MPDRLTLTQRLLSYLRPLTLETAQQDTETPLELVLSHGRYHLYTRHTIYSNSLQYAPFAKSYRYLYPRYPLPDTVLMLGAGLGAGLEIMHRRYKHHPQSTLVDINPQMKVWAEQYVFAEEEDIVWNLDGVQNFLSTNTQKYDLIGVDLFIKLEPLDCIYEESFIQEIKKASKSGGFVIINIILHPGRDLTKYKELLSQYFEIKKVIEQGRSKFLILQNTK